MNTLLREKADQAHALLAETGLDCWLTFVRETDLHPDPGVGRWPCYGRNVEAVVEAGNVFTLELGVPTDSGYIGLEEDVLVTAAGCEFLSSRQRDLMLI
jgi:Xaa-Pro aminopeptidase